jgi:hypothetical protein
MGDKPLPEIGQVAVCRAHLLSQWATPKFKQLQNWKRISKPSQHAEIKGPADRSLTLPQRKGPRQRNKPSVNKNSKNPTPKQDSWWTTKLISGTWGQHTNLNCHTPLREELTKQLPLKDRRKNNITQTPGETMTELWIKYQHQDWMLKE